MFRSLNRFTDILVTQSLWQVRKMSSVVSTGAQRGSSRQQKKDKSATQEVSEGKHKAGSRSESSTCSGSFWSRRERMPQDKSDNPKHHNDYNRPIYD